MQLLDDSVITSSVGVIFTLILRRSFRGKLSSMAIYLLWTVLLIRLVAPACPSSSISIFNKPPFISGQAEKVHRLEIVDSENQKEVLTFTICYILLVSLFIGTILTKPTPMQAEKEDYLEIPKTLIGAFEQIIEEEASINRPYEIKHICEEEKYIYLLLSYKSNRKSYERFMVLTSNFI